MRVALRLASVLLAAWTGFAPAPRALPQGTDVAPIAEVATEDLEAERAAVAQSLASAQQALDSHQDTAPPEALVQEVDLLKRLEIVLGQRLAERGITQTTGEDLTRIAGELERLIISGPVEERPFTFDLLDAVQDERVREAARDASLNTTLASAEGAVEQALQQSEARGSAWRKAKEAADVNRDDQETAALAVALRLADLERSVADHRLSLRKRELSNARDQVTLHFQRLELLDEKLDAVRREASLSEDDLRRKTAEIGLAEEAHRERLDAIDNLLRFVGPERLDAQRRLLGALEQDPVLVAEVALRDTQTDVLQKERLFLTQVLEHAQLDGVVWQRRAALSRGDVEDIEKAEWRRETKQALLDLEHDLTSFEFALEEARPALEAAETQLAAVAVPSREAGWIRERRRELKDYVDTLTALRQLVEKSVALHGRLLVELGEEDGGFDLGRSLSRAWGGFQSVWGYEVATVEEAPISVGDIATGILLMTIGVWLSRIFSGRFVYWALQRFNVNKGAAAAIRTLVFYALVLTCGLFALRWVNVPLTAFTILGGALAIGVGFGSQNIVNNFISGLILLAERPISVGDVVELDDLHGTVEYIGARSTRIRTGENVEILVPNSSLIESNVVNWTLSDKRIRASVVVGVAYGSPTRDVQKLLLRAADEHGKVLNKPERPFVTFDEFGDNSLVFTVHFWIEVRRIMDRRRIESDLRYIIDSLFRDSDITIAFPQRDVHLDTLSPLAVRIERQGPPEE